MMRTKLFAMCVAACSLLLGSSRASTPDLQAMSNLLLEAKTEAVALNSDAQELSGFTRTGAGWQTHASKLNEMKEHANKASRILQDVDFMKLAGSAWQQVAIERIMPLLSELIVNLQATIERLDENQDRVDMPAYKEFAAANAELAANLSETISNFVNYAQAKAKFEKLGSKLEISPNE